MGTAAQPDLIYDAQVAIAPDLVYTDRERGEYHEYLYHSRSHQNSREKNHYTQANLAQLLGGSDRAVSKWEPGVSQT